MNKVPNSASKSRPSKNRVGSQSWRSVRSLVCVVIAALTSQVPPFVEASRLSVECSAPLQQNQRIMSMTEVQVRLGSETYD